MRLLFLFNQLAELFNGSEPIEAHARNALLNAAEKAEFNGGAIDLPAPFQEVMTETVAHPVCQLIGSTPLPWAPPRTSDDKMYTEHSKCKVHVELLGPGGLVKSGELRLGLYGMMPNSKYGIRTHPAEEIYIMLAGQAFWKRAELPYTLHHPGERSYHPSMMEHGTQTGEKAFMSIYVWHGDISTANYVYSDS